MIIDYYAVLKEVRILVKQSGLNLVYEDTSQPRTDGKTMYVQKPDVSWSENDLVVWKGNVYHEAGHNEPKMKDVFELLRTYKLSTKSMIGFGLNILDDYRQEKYKLGVFLGRDKTLSKSNAILLNNIVENRKQQGVAATQEKLDDSEIVDTISAWSTYARKFWQRDLIGIDNAYRNVLRTEQQEKYDKLCADYTTKLNDVVTAEDEYALLLEILEKVFERDPEEEEEKSQAQAQEAEGSGNGKPTDEEGEGKAIESGRIKYEDIMIHNHDRKDDSYHNSRMIIDYSTKEDAFDFRMDVEPVVRDYTKLPLLENSRFTNAVNRLETGAGFANKIKKLLQVKTQCMKVHGQKKGKIASKSIYRAALKNTGSSQQKVFSKKEQRYSLDVAITVLVDNSGSMSGERLHHATKSAMLLNESISKLNVPVEILGFTEDGPIINNIFKTFTKQVSSDKLLERIATAATDLGYNADGASILWAYERLVKQKSKRKLMIVLSDGMPSSYHGDADVMTKTVIKKIEKESIVEMYGIGIQSDSVERYYYHNAVIQNASELESTLLNVIKNYILK